MARQIQLRRGTAIQHTTFTGANGEVTVDTTNKTLRVHDGTTPGGTPLARADSVTDMSGADYVVAWQTPTDQNNYTWYRKYKSGWVEQGGFWLGNIEKPLPIVMQNPNYTLLCSLYNDEANNNVHLHGIKIYSKTKNSFIIKATYDSQVYNYKLYWFAYGFAEN